MNVGRASVSDHVKVPKVYSITFPAKRVGGKGIQDCVRTQVQCFPDHTTFRDKGATLACADSLKVSSLKPYVIRPTLTPYNKPNIMTLKKCETGRKCRDCPLFHYINHLMMLVGLIF